MPLFQPSPKEKFIPKQIKLSKLFYFNTEGKSLGPSTLYQAKQALKQSGYSPEAIRKIVSKDEPISVKEFKAVARILSDNKVYGFEKNPDFSVKDYLNKQRVRAQSIARITKEHILEAAEEDYSKKGVTTLNTKGTSPNALKAGESSILAKKRRSNAAYSISGAGETKTISSFGQKASNETLNKPTGAGGISRRPGY